MTVAGAAPVIAAVLAVDDTAVSPGVVGFLVVALLGVATYLLIRSMNRQIKRIDLPDDDGGAGPEGREDPSDVPGDRGAG